MRKFERAAGGAIRERKHEILDKKQKPNSVELGGSSSSTDQKTFSALPQSHQSQPVSTLATRRHSDTAPAIQPASIQTTASRRSGYVAAVILVAVIVAISGVIYFA